PSTHLTSISASYGFGDELSTTNPLRGGNAEVSATWGSKYFGGDVNSYAVGADAAWILPFHPSHFVALRGSLGRTGPSGIPSTLQYHLGGINSIRGLSVDDDRFKGRNIFLLGGEYRHFLIQDIDVDLWVFRLRDLQGALFVDTGNVTDTVQE